MSNVSKLVIKACSDNKFSSFTGEFITSINPENLIIKSSVSYHVPEGMMCSSLLKYRGSPPKLLSFSLLFDNTGIMPGSNTIAVMEQVKQLQDVAYSVHKKNNAPNYIRIIWGQIDFKGRLVDLDITYAMFQVDGTLVRAEAHISVLEELVPLGKGQSAVGVDSNYAKASGVDATLNQRVAPSQGPPSQEVFAPTPNGMHGAYSGAPPGAYDGGPDAIYQGSNGAIGGSGYGSSVGTGHAGRSASSVEMTGSSGYGSVGAASYTIADQSSSGLKGGVAGNGPGGSGGGVGGGGHGSASGLGQSRGAPSSSGTGSHVSSTGSSGSSRGAGSGLARANNNLASGPASSKSKGKGSHFKAGSIVAAGVAGSAAAAAVAGGADSLRTLSDLKVKANRMKGKVDFLRRVKNFAKKVAPRAYNAGKKLLN